MLLQILIHLSILFKLNEKVRSPVLKKIMPRRPKDTKVTQSFLVIN